MLSFRRFLGLNLCDAVPDSRTVWVFRERLVEAKTLERPFHAYREHLLGAGLITREGSLVDASFVTVPKQRNSREETSSSRRGKYRRSGRTRSVRTKIATLAGPARERRHSSVIRTT